MKESELKMTANEMAKKSTRVARTKAAKIGDQQKAVYLKLKMFALEKEKKNYSKLFIIHNNGDWWKMIGNSAIIFHCEIAKRIGMGSKLVQDSDFDFKSEDGVVNIRNIDMLETRLEANSINPLEIKPEYRIYNLGKKYLPSEIENMKKAKALEYAKVNKIMMPEEIHPVLFMMLRELLKKTYFAIRIVEPVGRRTVTDEITIRAVKLVREYSLASKSKEAMKKYLESMETELDYMTAQMINVSELRLMPLERTYSILRAIEKVRKELSACKAKI